MRKLLACSILVLSLFGNVFAEEAKKEEPTKEEAVPRNPIVLKDVVCGSPKELNARLKELKMIPVLATESEVNQYQTVVWMNPSTKDTVFTRYIDNETACIIGMGMNFMMKYPKDLI